MKLKKENSPLLTIILDRDMLINKTIGLISCIHNHLSYAKETEHIKRKDLQSI